MEASANSNRIHPLVAAASVSVIVVSLVGVAAMTGLIPSSHSSSSPTAAANSPTVIHPTPLTASASAVTAPTTATAFAPEPVAAPTLGSKPAAQTAKKEVEPAPKRVASSSQSERSYAPRPAKVAQSSSENDYREPVRYRESARYSEPTRVAQAPAICYECGRVESVNAVQTQAGPSGLGMVAGGVIGGLLGNQVGEGKGKQLATVAGVVGGGYAGHEIERRNRVATTYEVRVRMEDGRVRTFPYNNQPHWSIGDRIRVVDGYLESRA